MTELQLLSVGYVLFMVLIGGEALLSWRRQDGRYRLGEFIVNIGHGAVFQVADGFTKFLVLGPFLLLSQVSLFELPMDSVWGWVVGLLAFDFATYWQHRHHHRIHALWAIHGVHHAAEDYNFAAALRQALFGNVTGWIWKAPLALLMPLQMFIIIVVFDYVYQFVQHTRYVPKLGPIEWVMNTPSHHRVHHGRQEKYIDKNYGGIFIIWDRLFHTFKEEDLDDEPDYGITMPPNSLNPVWGNLVLWQDLRNASAKTPGIWNKAKLWLGPPEWTEQLAGPVEHRAPNPLENADVPVGRLRYAALTFMGAVPLLGALAWVPEDAWMTRMALAAVVVISVLTPAAILEGKAWGPKVELLRIVFAGGLLAAMAGTEPAVVLGALGLVLMSAIAGALAVALAGKGESASTTQHSQGAV